jgi:hypothetical protein
MERVVAAVKTLAKKLRDEVNKYGRSVGSERRGALLCKGWVGATAAIDGVMMMSADDIVTDHPARGRTEEDVRGEMLLGEDTGERDSGCSRIDPNLLPGRGIFSRDYCSC